MRRTLFTVFLALVLLVSPMTVAAAEDPRFETYVPEPTLTPGTQQQVTVQLINDAREPDDRVETARDVKATVKSGKTPIEVKSGTRLLGPMRDGQVASFSVLVSVPTTIDAGTYKLPIEVEYIEDGDNRKTKTVYANVQIEDRAQFLVERADSSVPVGDSGPVNVTVTNVGTLPANAASVQVTSTHSDIVFGQSPTASRYVGTWEPGETRTLQYEGTAMNGADTRSYTIQAVVNYEDTDGNDARSSTLKFGVTPLPEQTFDVENVQTTLRVGREGTLEGTVVNTGATKARNVVVAFQSSNPNINPLEPEYAVGDLEPGQSSSFSFDIEVSDAAEAGPRQVSMQVTYRNADGDKRVGDPIDVRVDIAEHQDDFAVEGLDTELTRGSSGNVQMRVTNTRGEPVSDISAKVFVDSPLSVSDDEAFIQQLAPGESATLTFRLSAGGSALTDKTYPVKVDFQFDTPDGDTLISDTYRVPLEVTEPEQQGPLSGFLPVVVGVVLVVAVVGGYLLYRRR